VVGKHWSSRQGKEITLGGVPGELEIEGAVGPLLPLLRGGELVHVGKSTSCGYKQMELREGADADR
jgi:hypothetical protein